MYDRTESKRDALFLLLSVLLHALIIALAPGMGSGPPGTPLALGGTVAISIVPVADKHPEKTTVQTTPKPQKVQAPAPKPVTETRPAPVAVTPPAVKPIPPDTGRSVSDRVLTEPTSPQEVPEVVAAKPSPSATVSEPEPEDEKNESPEPPAPPPPPPLVGDVVGGFGPLRHYPAKEAALLTRNLRALVEVTITTDGASDPRLLTPTGNAQLDRWVTQTAARQLRYTPASEPYVATIEVMINPDTNKVTLSSTEERVRFVQP